MQKQPLKEPIYLTKLKRRSKIIQHSLHPQTNLKQNIAYDLQIHPEALAHQPNRQIYYKDQKQFQEEFANKNKIHSSAIGVMSNRQAKPNTLRIADACQSSLFNNLSQYFSMGDKRGFLIDKNRDNEILEQSQLINLKARAIRTINNCKDDVLKQVKLFQAHNIDQNHSKSKRKPKDQAVNMNETYQKKIIQLQQRNAHLENRVSQLQQQLKKKEDVEVRIMKIQKDLSQLLVENMELQKINEQLLTKSQIKLKCLQACIQTDYVPRYVQDSYCQTSIPDPQPRFSFSQLKYSQQGYEDLWNRAKTWKRDLQRQRVLAFNREIQFKALLENTQIEARRELQFFQRQLQILNVNFNRKCLEIQQKETVIHRLLQQIQS